MSPTVSQQYPAMFKSGDAPLSSTESYRILIGKTLQKEGQAHVC